MSKLIQKRELYRSTVNKMKILQLNLEQIELELDQEFNNCTHPYKYIVENILPICDISAICMNYIGESWCGYHLKLWTIECPYCKHTDFHILKQRVKCFL